MAVCFLNIRSQQRQIFFNKLCEHLEPDISKKVVEETFNKMKDWTMDFIHDLNLDKLRNLLIKTRD